MQEVDTEKRKNVLFEAGAVKTEVKLCEKNTVIECFVDMGLTNMKLDLSNKCGLILFWIILWINLFKNKLIFDTFKMARTLIAMILWLWKLRVQTG